MRRDRSPIPRVLKKQDGSARGGIAGVVSLRFVTPVFIREVGMATSKPKNPRPGRKTLPPEEKMSVRVEVSLTPAQAERLDTMRGRLSRAEFLRDRAFSVDNFYEPSIAAIGSLYLLAMQLRQTLVSFASAATALAQIESEAKVAIRRASSPDPQVAQTLKAVSRACEAYTHHSDDYLLTPIRILNLAREMGARHLGVIHARGDERHIKRKGKVTR